MPLPVKLKDVAEALEVTVEEHAQYLDKRAGEIVLITNEEMWAAEEDELISDHPEWQRESILKAREIRGSEGVFVQLPDQFDIHEYQIMEVFCVTYANRQLGEHLHRLIKGSGAFRRFKNAIFSWGIHDDWFAFRKKALEIIAIEWLEQHEIPYTDDDVITAPDQNT